MLMDGQIRIAGIVDDSIVDGPGLRLTVFAQGCPHGCPGCHNRHTHDENGGYTISVSEILAKVDKNPLLDGVTLSGGEPFMQYEAFAELAREIKNRGLSVMAYTGYTWERLVGQYDKYGDFLGVIDILVDGPFISEEKSHTLTFKGSKNQRIIDVKKSMESGFAVQMDIARGYPA